MTPIERWFAKVHRPQAEGQCWYWLGATHGSREKRGQFWNGSKNVDAARWIYQQRHPCADLSGGVVMHSCDNSLCVNPDHLSLGTQADNVADMHAKKRSHHHRDPSIQQASGRKTQAFFRAHPERRLRGEAHGKSKLTDAQRSMVVASKRPTSELAAELGVHRTTIQKARSTPSPDNQGE